VVVTATGLDGGCRGAGFHGLKASHYLVVIQIWALYDQEGAPK
jgi:hypothetical protein